MIVLFPWSQRQTVNCPLCLQAWSQATWVRRDCRCLPFPFHMPVSVLFYLALVSFMSKLQWRSLSMRMFPVGVLKQIPFLCSNYYLRVSLTGPTGHKDNPALSLSLHLVLWDGSSKICFAKISKMLKYKIQVKEVLSRWDRNRIEKLRLLGSDLANFHPISMHQSPFLVAWLNLEVPLPSYRTDYCYHCYSSNRNHNLNWKKKKKSVH